MASPSELGLDSKPHSYSMLLKSVGEQSDQSYKLEEFLSRLEEERLKIDAFKRELPLCMQLLTNGKSPTLFFFFFFHHQFNLIRVLVLA
jgi:hypothetical protein